MMKIDPIRSDILQIARALAALMVVSRHARNALLVDYPQLTQPNLAEKFLYFMTGLGHEAVIVFFVMSGYLVGGSILRSRHQFDWKHYVAARLSRVWSVLIPALVLTAICDFFLLRYLSHTLTPEGLLANHMIQLPLLHDPGTLLMNMFFLKEFIGPTFGSNGPLWSLTFEVWCYLIFPLLLFGILGSGRGYERGLMVLLAVILLAWAPSRFQVLFCIWSIGVLVNVIPAPQIMMGRLGGAVLLWVALGSVFISRSGKLTESVPGYALDVMIGLCFAAWMRHVHAGVCMQPPLFLRRAGVAVSRFSYSLYATQMPVMCLVVACVAPQRLPSSPENWAALALLIAFLFLVARCFWWLFERNVGIWRSSILSVLTWRGSGLVTR